MLENRPGPAGFDLEWTLALTDGDMELIKELAGLFLADYPRLLAKLRSAVNAGNAREVEVQAHSLKGAAANFGAQAVVASAFCLEKKGSSSDLTNAAEEYQVLDTALGSLAAELRALV